MQTGSTHFLHQINSGGFIYEDKGRKISAGTESYQEIDAFEVNEAFAVIDVLFERAFPGIEDRYNIWGGALAYGHPYGVSGAMILLHLMKALEHKNGHLGMCCVAAAGGIGSSILVEKVMK